MIDTLEQIKAAWDWIAARTPQKWANRIEFVKGVATHEDNANKWLDNRSKAELIWQAWETPYERLSAPANQPLPVAYPQRNVVTDLTKINDFKSKFETVHAGIAVLLGDAGLAEVKQKLAKQWYLAVNKTIDGATNQFYAAHPDETLAQFKGRFKVLIDTWVTPGQVWWLQQVSFHFAMQGRAGGKYCHTRQLQGMPNNYGGGRVHWTVFKDSLGNLAQLKVTDSFDRIKGALLPSGSSGVHVTWEYYGQGSPNRNPHVFGRPASIYNNMGYQGNGNHRTTLAQRLNDENDRLVQLIQTSVNTRSAHLRNDWNEH